MRSTPWRPLLLLGAALVGCNLVGCKSTPRPPPAPPEPVPSGLDAKPRLITGTSPIAPFVADQVANAQGTRIVVYVGATWCEPCQRFHQALTSGELDTRLRGIRFIEYDYDAHRQELSMEGFRARLVPLFSLPTAKGRASTRFIQGSVKGAGAVDDIEQRLHTLLETQP